MSTVVLQQTGGDYMVNIPQKLIQRLNLKPGAILDIRAEHHRLTIEPLDAECAEIQAIHQDLMDDYQVAFKKLAA
jgi:antitoxin component of MazEF toxin-antitoxin module